MWGVSFSSSFSWFGWLVQKIAWPQSVTQWISLVGFCFKANSSRIKVTSGTNAVGNVWTITTTSLGVRVVVGNQSAVILWFWLTRLILRVSFFWLGWWFLLFNFCLFQWQTNFYYMARFVGQCAKLSEILLLFGVLWIIIWINRTTFNNYIVNFIQSFFNVCKTWVSGVGWSTRTRLL